MEDAFISAAARNPVGVLLSAIRDRSPERVGYILDMYPQTANAEVFAAGIGMARPLHCAAEMCALQGDRAAEENSVHVLRALLLAGANPLLPNKPGDRASDIVGKAHALYRPLLDAEGEWLNYKGTVGAALRNARSWSVLKLRI